MNDGKTLLELRFTGSSIQPSVVSLGHLSGVLEAIEDLIHDTISNEYGRKETTNLTIALDTIRSGSVWLAFDTSDHLHTFPAWRTIAKVINNGYIDQASRKTRESLQKIWRFCKRHQCEAEFRFSDQAEPIATITSDMDLSLETTIKGQTSLYGEVVVTGGIDPYIQIKPLNGKTIHCKASAEMAKSVAQRLYEVIGIEGIATWDIETMEIVGFEISEILEYTQTQSIVETFNDLRNAIGHHFDDIHDVDAYIQQLREDSPEV